MHRNIHRLRKCLHWTRWYRLCILNTLKWANSGMWRALSTCQRAAPSWGHGKHYGWHQERPKNGERHKDKSRGALSKEGRGWALQVSLQAKKHLRSSKRCKRTIRDPAFGLLVTTRVSHLFLLSNEEINLQFKLLEGRGISIFHEEIFTPVVYTWIPIICTILSLVSVVNSDSIKPLKQVLRTE